MATMVLFGGNFGLSMEPPNKRSQGLDRGFKKAITAGCRGETIFSKSCAEEYLDYM
ncbi:hypothetical protein DSCO28_49330 [Desulfosarcina ovata subsp. sediminis]|uniref:Uncharacterized protein n=1 Tax=Desulfosarcina ovata subsp. sediminis TaxID=885957 RepID=A0A5K7ZVU2_9BACT|nr:hypothetical protein DSCO28_49330 [Desulfosarcina ovata subsp. sediminis]